MLRLFIFLCKLDLPDTRGQSTAQNSRFLLYDSSQDAGQYCPCQLRSRPDLFGRILQSQAKIHFVHKRISGPGQNVYPDRTLQADLAQVEEQLASDCNAELRIARERV